MGSRLVTALTLFGINDSIIKITNYNFMSKIAVIKTGGKQYKVSEKDAIKIEKILGKAGDKVLFDQVLMIADGDNVEVGKPFLEGNKVEGKILEQGRAKKVLVVKYKPKTRYKKRVGHRQSFTKVEVTQI